MNAFEDLMQQMNAVLHYDGMFHARATGCNAYAKHRDPLVAMTKALELRRMGTSPIQDATPSRRRRILWED